MFWLCGSIKNIKITPSPLESNRIQTCDNCKDQKSLITLKCEHIYCVKCYNKGNFYCKDCDRKKSKFRLFC